MFEIPYKTFPLDKDFRINAEDYRAENGGVIIPNPNAPTSLGEGRRLLKS
jgi:histidinol-phosphate aminotransferase